MSFARALAAASQRRTVLEQTTAYRLVNAEGDGLPGITIDWFDQVAVLSFYREAAPDEEGQIASALSGHGARAVYLKRRPREAREVATTQKQQVAPERPILGESIAEVIVSELGLRFSIRPSQGLSVGLYLDARDARGWVRSNARGRTVLNCFAYTCGFGVAAVAGGATRVVNVDVSRKVLDWGEDNARLNAQAPARADHLSGDVFDWLGRLSKKRQTFGMVILDPPSFATTRTSRFSAASDYPALVEAAAPLVEPAGLLLTCCNLAALTPERFEAMVLTGARSAARPTEVLSSFGASAIDFPSLPGQGSALKVIALKLR